MDRKKKDAWVDAEKKQTKYGTVSSTDFHRMTLKNHPFCPLLGLWED